MKRENTTSLRNERGRSAGADAGRTRGRSSGRLNKLSKFLSYVLRHKPQSIGIELDDAGWANVDDLLIACGKANKRITLPFLQQVVEQDDKGRYSFSPDGARIRANQGHSIDVALGYETLEPLAQLYHGTFLGARDAISREGLRKMNRHHVHLSADVATARQVGGRRGKALIFTVDASAMHAAGYAFRRSTNGVWLVDSVPPQYLSLY